MTRTTDQKEGLTLGDLMQFVQHAEASGVDPRAQVLVRVGFSAQIKAHHCGRQAVTQPATIAEFLEARIDEDERWSQSALALRGSGTYWHIGHPLDPARALAECAAKRAIIEVNKGDKWTIPPTPSEYEYWHSGGPLVEVRHNDRHLRSITFDEYLTEVCAVKQPPASELRTLAAIYKHHPDYRQEWAL